MREVWLEPSKTCTRLKGKGYRSWYKLRCQGKILRARRGGELKFLVGGSGRGNSF